MESIAQRDSRTAMLLGVQGMARLRAASVLVFGAGGVGGAAIEALARAGVGIIGVVDHDTVSESNLNRQILALRSNVGMKKTDAAAERIREIDLQIRTVPYDLFYSAETADRFDFSAYDFVIDAIDTVPAKLLLAVRCCACGTPLVASMGTGNKLDPAQLRMDDIYKTSGCPLARVMRRELKKLGIRRLPVVWSPEEPKKPLFENEDGGTGKRAPGSVSFVPPVAGYLLAGYVIRKLSGVEE